jgi:putative ABC transport system ATP-binding protein
VTDDTALQEMVQARDVHRRYGEGQAAVDALAGVSVDFPASRFAAIMGPSGSGKSTLMHILAGLDRPTSGTVRLAGVEITGLDDAALTHLRRDRVGFIFQTFNLLPVLSAAENVEYPLLQFRELDAAERRERVRHYLDVVGLADFADHRPNQLSGGQRQRVAIARALAVRPKIVLADEPTANLDHKTGMRILRLMRSINRKTGATFVFSTHDKRVIDMADRRVDLEDGEIIRLGIRKGRKEWGYALERSEDIDDLADSTLGEPAPTSSASSGSRSERA